jgi:hypothetical protein
MPIKKNTNVTMNVTSTCTCGKKTCIGVKGRGHLEKMIVENKMNCCASDDECVCADCRNATSNIVHRPNDAGLYDMHRCEYIQLFLKLDAYIFTIENENHKFDSTLAVNRERLRESIVVNSKAKQLYKNSLNVNQGLIEQNSKLRQENKILKQERKQLNKIISNIKFSSKTVEEDEGDSDSDTLVDSDDYDNNSDALVDEGQYDEHIRTVPQQPDKYTILTTYAKVKNYMISKNTTLSRVLYSMKLSKHQVEYYRNKFTQLRLKRNEVAHPVICEKEEIEDTHMFLQALR